MHARFLHVSMAPSKASVQMLTSKQIAVPVLGLAVIGQRIHAGGMALSGHHKSEGRRAHLVEVLEGKGLAGIKDLRSKSVLTFKLRSKRLSALGEDTQQNGLLGPGQILPRGSDQQSNSSSSAAQSSVTGRHESLPGFCCRHWAAQTVVCTQSVCLLAFKTFPLYTACLLCKAALCMQASPGGSPWAARQPAPPR